MFYAIDGPWADFGGRPGCRSPTRSPNESCEIAIALKKLDFRRVPNVPFSTATRHCFSGPGSVGEVFAAALRLGMTSFGGPVAHIGYFREDYVIRRRWLDEHAFSELVGLCQFLPGPASSQLGFAIGWLRAGRCGALAAWLGFTLPSALLMFAFAHIAGSLRGNLADAAIHGLKIAAIAIVAQAVLGMRRTLAPDGPRLALAAAAAATMLLLESPLTQVLVIAAAAGIGAASALPVGPPVLVATGLAPDRKTGAVVLGAFALLLAGLPVLAALDARFALADAFYRAGALVFGGGHVVLPLLRDGLVPAMVGQGEFLAGYGAAQALPGPLFSLASYLGSLASPPRPLAGALTATVAIFAPGLLLVTGALAFRARLFGHPAARRAVAGINAAVVGVLAAALYDPLWTAGVASVWDIGIAAVGLVLLTRLRAPALLVVALSVAASCAPLVGHDLLGEATFPAEISFSIM